MVIVLFFFLVVFLFVSGSRRNSEAGLPIFLNGWGKLVHVREEHRDLPHFVWSEGLIPGWHAGVANAGADCVEDVPLGIVRRIRYEIRRRRIERSDERRRLAIKTSMAEGAVHGVKLHAIFEVRIGRSERIVDTGRV